MALETARRLLKTFTGALAEELVLGHHLQRDLCRVPVVVEPRRLPDAAFNHYEKFIRRLSFAVQPVCAWQWEGVYAY